MGFSQREESKTSASNSSLQSYEELFSKVKVSNAKKEGKDVNDDKDTDQAKMISENVTDLL